MKITCYFSQMKGFPLLWLRNPLDLSLYDRNIIGSSSETFGYLRKSSIIFGNFSETFVWPSDNFEDTNTRYELWIRILSLSVQLDISRVSALPFRYFKGLFIKHFEPAYLMTVLFCFACCTIHRYQSISRQ